METAGHLLDALYNRLLLRDIFGRVVPGFAVLSALALFFNLPNSIPELTNSLNFGQWLLLVAAAWICAFTVQRFGEMNLWPTGRLIFYSPPFRSPKASRAQSGKVVPAPPDVWKVLRDDPLWWYKLVIPFRTAAADTKESEHLLQLERVIVIKEACGNTYVALIVAVALVLMHFTFNLRSRELFSFDLVRTSFQAVIERGPVVLLVPCAIGLLRRLHLLHAWRQYTYARLYLRERKYDVSMYPEARPPTPEVLPFLSFLFGFWFAGALVGYVLGVLATRFAKG